MLLTPDAPADLFGGPIQRGGDPALRLRVGCAVPCAVDNAFNRVVGVLHPVGHGGAGRMSFWQHDGEDVLQGARQSAQRVSSEIGMLLHPGGYRTVSNLQGDSGPGAGQYDTFPT